MAQRQRTNSPILKGLGSKPSRTYFSTVDSEQSSRCASVSVERMSGGYEARVFFAHHGHALEDLVGEKSEQSEESWVRTHEENARKVPKSPCHAHVSRLVYLKIGSVVSGFPLCWLNSPSSQARWLRSRHGCARRPFDGHRSQRRCDRSDRALEDWLQLFW
jgi:hypothetical protein